MMGPRSQEETIAEIMRLHYVDGLGLRTIAARLEVSRNTVRRVLGRKRRKPPQPHQARPSMLQPYQPTIKKWLDDTPELKATTILERLRGLGFTGGITIVRD